MARFSKAIASCLAAGVLLAAAAPAQAWPFHRRRGFWPVWSYDPYATYPYLGYQREDLWCLEQRYLEKRYREKGQVNQDPADAKRLPEACKQKQETPDR